MRAPDQHAPYPVPSARQAFGAITPPASKSVSHRYLNLAFLAGRALTIERPLDAEDIRLFRAALSAAGTGITEHSLEGTGEVAIELRPGAAAPADGEGSDGEGATLFCGNAGTMARFLVASCAAVPGRWTVDGTERLRQRPVGPLFAALHQLGAEIEELGRPGCPPVRIQGGNLRGGRAQLDAGESSQYLSALLMAGLRAEQETEIRVEALTSEPYVAITLEAIQAFGGTVSQPEPSLYRIRPGLEPPSRLRVEGDYSAACYPAAAAALTGGQVRLRGLARDSAQGDRAFLELLATMGARVDWVPQSAGSGEWKVEGPGSGGGGLRAPGRIDLSAMPDQVPTLAALAPFAHGETRIVNVAHLRIKESDRLAAMARELTRVGAQVEELPDGLRIPGIWAGEKAGSSKIPDQPVVTDSHDDHRIAMSLALVGLRRPGISIGQPAVVTKSYPGFWKDLEAMLRSAR